MKFIIFQSIDSAVSAFGYNTSIKIAYMLNANVTSLGFDEMYYYMDEDALKWGFEMQLKLLKNYNLPEDELQSILNAERSFKIYNKTKNKSSQAIVAIQQMKKVVGLLFKEHVKDQADKLDSFFGLRTMRPLLNKEYFYFYPTSKDNIIDKNARVTTLKDVLQLHLPDPEKGSPLFFLNVETDKGENIIDIDILDPENQLAEKSENSYGVKSVIFPLLTSLSTDQFASLRKQFMLPTMELRAKLEEWATICYQNPNSNLGLDYFRKELKPLLLSLKNLAFENALLKNIGEFTNQNLQSQIIIGEMPIEKIWENYKKANTISQELYDDLMKIKSEQKPKFDGRWPVIFFKSLEKTKEYFQPESQDSIVKSARKSISVD